MFFAGQRSSTFSSAVAMKFSADGGDSCNLATEDLPGSEERDAFVAVLTRSDSRSVRE